MSKGYKLQVEAIKNGTVIDHIPAHIAFKVMKRFKLYKTNERVIIGLNLPSSALGAKDLIKIENFFISTEQTKQLAIYAPQATVNQIKNYTVIAKLPLALPDTIIDVFNCPNTNCITHDERAVTSSFIIVNKTNDLHLKCKYCEKIFSRVTMTGSN
ncbi:aspartate carbamoyltransferase regulatory subunit [Candidatus Enterovibrio altilux]|uniref:Aspartate carbamoyltransferase regulatory chain n=1 Tax=Candidatus Enterovibrio altilux TaxID=1927128 RepID=A0A291B7C0_9GAMM|nr:aspartate carbamoyltransferase regulatory subunit [Candidatus Enterovibrio luxaltus]ATF08909.1 Aspartate carbamoyltransferase regulatory chain (PyrI) [Candidatus Enterovibrio luxaltus]